MKLAVTKTFDGEEVLCFEESEVRKACEREECEKELIEDCVEGMGKGTVDCMTCYLNLVKNKVGFKYRTVK